MDRGTKGGRREREGMTEPKPWPRNAEYARLDAIAEIMGAHELASRLMCERLGEVERLRVTADLRDTLQEARHILVLAKQGKLKEEGL